MALKNKKAAPAKPVSTRKAIKIAEPPVRAPHSEAYEAALTAYGEALDLLRKKDFASALPRFRAVASQNRNIKLRKIAQRVIDTGQEPDVA